MNKQQRINLANSDWDKFSRRYKVSATNPVFVKGLALTPIIIAATNFENSLIISMAVILLLTPTRVITSLITKRMSVPLKTFFYPLVSAILFGGIYYFMYLLLGEKVVNIGVYLPILIIDPLIVKNFEKTRKESFLFSIINGLRNTAGFVVACLLVGAVRELLSTGSILNFKILEVSLFPMATKGFGGFLIVALICAIWNGLIIKYRQHMARLAGDN